MNLSDIGKHCIWADRELATLFSSVTKKQFNEVPESTGRSLCDLVVHLLAGYEMVLGGDYMNVMNTYGQKEQSELLEIWKNAVEKFITAIESDPSKSFTITMDDGSKQEVTGQNYLLAYTDHSTYHRGQMVTTFKVITGQEAVSTDFYTYLTKKKTL